jgi:hypothetical protein
VKKPQTWTLTCEIGITLFFFLTLLARPTMGAEQEKLREQGERESQRFFVSRMQKKQLFKPLVNVLNKKTKNVFSYDFYIRSVYGFLKFKCF